MTATDDIVEAQSSSSREFPAEAADSYDSDNFETADELSAEEEEDDEEEEPQEETPAAAYPKTICNLQPEASAALLEWRRRSLIVRATGPESSRKSELVDNFKHFLKIKNSDDGIVNANDIVEKLWRQEDKAPYNKSLVSFLGSS